MRCSKSEASPPVPLRLPPVNPSHEGTLVDPPRFRVARADDDGSRRQAVADLIDLVANHGSDLLAAFLDVVQEAESTRAHAKELMELVTSCGVAESASPCATAIAIAADLETLAAAAHGWTHPAQIVRHPNVSALYRLCAARVAAEHGLVRRRLEKILPRLERTARLTERAAARRHQAGGRHS